MPPEENEKFFTEMCSSLTENGVMNRVYIVDDDAGVRNSLAFLLASTGLAVETHGSAPGFLDACCPEMRGCIVMDVHMPVIDGPALLAELLKRGIRLPVIFLSAYGDIPLTVRAIKAGAMDFLTKPVDASILLDRVHSAFELHARLLREAETKQSIFSRLDNLTEREHEVMRLAVSGHPNKEIAKRLGISYRTVEIHRSRVMQKTGASSLLELARIAADFIEQE